MDTPKPGDFPVGSVESRAAMRLQLAKQAERPHLGFISHIPRPWREEDGDKGPKPKDWNEVPRIEQPTWLPGSLTLYVPSGMSEEEARKWFTQIVGS